MPTNAVKLAQRRSNAHRKQSPQNADGPELELGVRCTSTANKQTNKQQVVDVVCAPQRVSFRLVLFKFSWVHMWSCQGLILRFSEQQAKYENSRRDPRQIFCNILPRTPPGVSRAKCSFSFLMHLISWQQIEDFIGFHFFSFLEFSCTQVVPNIRIAAKQQHCK
jgi:hypothetical protein